MAVATIEATFMGSVMGSTLARDREGSIRPPSQWAATGGKGRFVANCENAGLNKNPA
jgi:hypothetical protein